MIEKIKTIVIVVLSLLLLICAGLAGKYKHELGEARLELERVRTDALALAERQRAIDGNLERAREIVERQQTSVSGGLGTIQEIRASLAEIRAYTQMLEDCLRDNGGSNSANNSSSSGNSSEPLERP